MILVEVHGGATGAVVEQRVGVELHDLAHLERLEQVLAELRDGGAGVGESGQPGDEVQAARHLGDVDREIVEAIRVAHTPILEPPPVRAPDRTARAVMLTANTQYAGRMAVPTLSITRTAPVDGRRRAARPRGAQDAPTGRAWPSDDPAFASIAAALSRIGATGAADELRRLPAPGGGRPIALIGLGSGPVTPDALRLRRRFGRPAAHRDRAARPRLARRVAPPMPLAVLEGAGIGAYAYTGYRVGSLGTTKTPADDIVVHLPDDVDADVTASSRVRPPSVTAIHTVRDLVNTPPSDLYPETLAAAAVDLAQGLPVDVEVLDESAARGRRVRRHPRRRRRFAARPARCSCVRYSPAGATKHLALVGKGITFDSGGLSLKPAAGDDRHEVRHDRRRDRARRDRSPPRGSALPVRITALAVHRREHAVGLVDAPERRAAASAAARTVEVLNTDAEGRLVLADGLVARARSSPTRSSTSPR